MSSSSKIAGIIFTVAAAQFALALFIAPKLHAGYSLSKYYLSDLGVGSFAYVFNLSAIILGLMLLAGTFFLRQKPNLKPASQLLFLMSFAVIAVGIFTKDLTVLHGIVSSVAFLFASMAALTFAKTLKKIPSLISLLFGGIIFCALALFSIGIVTSGSLTSTVAYDSPFYLGLGPGGMESMIVIPALLWLAIFSVCLITEKGFKDAN